MKLHERVFDLFASLNQGEPGRFELVTPVRKIALDLSGGQVLGIDGVPELLTDLTELRGLKLSGRLSQDLNVALTQGVSYETAAYAAADNLGRLLVHLLGHPHVETRFKQAPPSPGAWPLPRSQSKIFTSSGVETSFFSWSTSTRNEVFQTGFKFFLILVLW